MKNIFLRQAALVIMMLGFVIQGKTQVVFVPEAGAEYRIKIAEGENAGLSLTYKGYNTNKNDGIAPVFETPDTSNTSQIFKFILMSGTAEDGSDHQYFIESIVDLDKSAMNDRGAFSRERSTSWHTLRGFENEGKYAIKCVGLGANNQRFTLYLNGTTFGFRDNTAAAEYKNNPPTADYDFVFEKVTQVDNSSLLTILSHAEAVIEKIEAKGVDAFGSSILGQYNENAYRDFEAAYQTANAGKNVISYESITLYENNLKAALNNLFASVAVPNGNYYMWNNYQNNFIGRIDNNPGGYLRFFSFSHGQDNLLFSFVKNTDDSYQIQYNDSRRTGEGGQYYLAADARGTTAEASAANTVVYYDISKGIYAIGFTTGGFLYFNNDDVNTNEARNRGSVLLNDYLFITIIEESSGQSFADLQTAVSAAATTQTTIESDGYDYNPVAVTNFQTTLAASRELLKYPTTATEITAITNELIAATTAYKRSRMFVVNEKNTAEKWPGLTHSANSNKEYLQNRPDDLGYFYGELKQGSTFSIGSFDFSTITELTAIAIECGAGKGTSSAEIYITDPTDETNKIVILTITLGSDAWTTKTEISTNEIPDLSDINGIHEIYVKNTTNGGFNLCSVTFTGIPYTGGTITWKADASDTTWENKVNWDLGRTPRHLDNVIIQANSNNKYPIVPATGAVINSIAFEPNAKIGNQHLLKITGDASVKMNLNTGRWYMLSMPMEATIKDFHFEQAPRTWFKTFAIDSDTGMVGWDYRTELGESYLPGTGFSYFVEKLPDLDQQEVVLTGSILDTNQTNINLDFGEDIDGDNTYVFALTGNPFMTSINFDVLQNANDGVISPNYMVWTGSGFVGYCGDGHFGAITDEYINVNNRTIPPLQAIIVEQAENHSSSELIFDLNTDNLQATESPIELRAAKSETNKLDIIASNGTGSVLTFIAKREEGRSAKKIKDISKMPDIYTLNGTTALGAQIVNTDNITIPLGISTSYSGDITLTFMGMSSYDADIKLIDIANNNKEIDLTGDSEIYTFSHTPKGNSVPTEDRFLIAFAPKTITGVEAGKENYISIQVQDQAIQAISTVSDPIKQIAVYDVHGRLVYENKHINCPAYTIRNIRTSGSPVYVVKLITEKTIKNVKLIID